MNYISDDLMTDDHHNPQRELELEFPVSPGQDLEQAAREFLARIAAPCELHPTARITHDLLHWKLLPPFQRSSTTVPQAGLLVAERGACAQCRERQRVAASGVPSRYLEASFAKFTADTGELRANLDACRRFAAKPRGFLVMVGTPGTGKTHLAASIIRSASIKSAMYIRHLDAVARMREDYRQVRECDRSSSIRRRLQSARLLVIDEAGIATGGNDADVLLHDIIDYRYGEMMPTVLLANVAPGAFAETFGERLTDRMREELFENKELTFTGRSRRRELNRFRNAL